MESKIASKFLSETETVSIPHRFVTRRRNLESLNSIKGRFVLFEVRMPDLAAVSEAWNLDVERRILDNKTSHYGFLEVASSPSAM